jgi:YebC/PmpR family DNA-binding regulatory protein
MSGHSKWSTIKRAKGVADQKRGQTFTKVAYAITLAARQGGSGDPNTNPRLRLAFEQARSVNMPKDNIQRAIDRGLGNLPGQQVEEVQYEGFGPGKVAFLIEGITDNRMRTTQEIKNMFDRAGGAIGSPGSTAYMFDHKGEILVTAKGGDKEEELLELIDTGAEDVEEYEEEGTVKYLVSTVPEDLNKVSTNITQLGYQVDSAELTYKPNMTVEIKDREVAEKVIEFAQKAEDHDDIQKVYANFDISDDLLGS